MRQRKGETREEYNARRRAWRAAYYRANCDEIKAKSLAWYVANTERAKARFATYYATNDEKLLEKRRQRHLAYKLMKKGDFSLV